MPKTSQFPSPSAAVTIGPNIVLFSGGKPDANGTHTLQMLSAPIPPETQAPTFSVPDIADMSGWGAISNGILDTLVCETAHDLGELLRLRHEPDVAGAGQDDMTCARNLFAVRACQRRPHDQIERLLAGNDQGRCTHLTGVGEIEPIQPRNPSRHARGRDGRPHRARRADHREAQ